MSILLFLVPLSLVLLVAAIWAFIWAVRKGQFEDMDTPAIDILREDPHERRRGPSAPGETAASEAAASGDPAGPDASAAGAAGEPGGPGAGRPSA